MRSRYLFAAFAVLLALAGPARGEDARINRLELVESGFYDAGTVTVLGSILSPGTEKIVEQQIPLHRLGTPDEVAKIIYVLCTEMGSYVNGAEIHINGGQHV